MAAEPYNGTDVTMLGLDQQRIGTFEPAIQNMDGVYTQQSGQYMRCGTQVNFGLDLESSVSSSITNQPFRIAGLPFSADAAAATALVNAQVFSIVGTVQWPFGVSYLYGFVEDGTNLVGVAGNGDGGGNSFLFTDGFTVGGQFRVRVTGSFQTDSP